MRVIKDESAYPIKLWGEDIEKGAIEQIVHLSKLPFVFKHIAIMPDCHQGYGMPIGGVLATQGVVIPNAVGVDIGCGMCAVKTSLKEIPDGTLRGILSEIREVIPVGFNHHKIKQDANLIPPLDWLDNTIIEEEYDSARHQIGTLGGGNHFIEIQRDEEGYVWIMLHSGSRNVGYKVARYYNDLAEDLNKKWYSNIPKEWELAFLPLNSEEGTAYLEEMSYCVEFALANRQLMMDRIIEVFKYNYEDVVYEGMINIAHNYAAMENHFGHNVMVHRKGATRAREGELGIIPGSQGTASYIVEGLGNRESFMSCSHGAGRRMGRRQAKRELNLEEEVKRLDDKGIIHSIRTENELDEAPSAYKDIDKVMEDQKDLVKIVTKLQPLAVIKG